MSICATTRQKKKTGPKPLSEKEYNRRMVAVLEMHELGHPGYKISEAVGFSAGPFLKKLMDQGKTEPIFAGRVSDVYDINSLRVRTIVDMKKNNAHVTLQEIADELNGLTRERARQLVNKIIARYGQQIFSADKKTVWTVAEAAKELNVEEANIGQLIRNKKIPCMKRKGYCQYKLDKAGMDALERYFSKKKTCAICGQEFVAKKCGKKKSEVCYGVECRKKISCWLRKKHCADKQKIINTLKGWRKDFWLALQKRKTPEKETWIELSEATKVSGLTKSQIAYLRQCGIISIQPRPESKNTKKENRLRGWYSLFSIGEMEIARGVIEKSKLK